MDRPRRNFVFAMDNSRQLIHFYKKNSDRSNVLESHSLNFLMEMEEARNTPRSNEKIYKKNLEYSSDSDSEAETKMIAAIEEEQSSHFQNMIWNFTDYFEEDEVKETKPKRNTFTAKDAEDIRKNPKEKSDFKIRSIRDLIDRWYFKSLAKDLVKIQPEPLKMETKMRCLNYILDAQKSDYEKAISADLYESYNDKIKPNI